MKGASKLQLKLTALKREPMKEQQTMHAQQYQGNKKNTKIWGNPLASCFRSIYQYCKTISNNWLKKKLCYNLVDHYFSSFLLKEIVEDDVKGLIF